jgi:hypothetical protein
MGKRTFIHDGIEAIASKCRRTSGLMTHASQDFSMSAGTLSGAFPESENPPEVFPVHFRSQKTRRNTLRFISGDRNSAGSLSGSFPETVYEFQIFMTLIFSAYLNY